MISVIIPSYNSYKTIPRTIDSLLSQPEAYVQEIIVVDSSDDEKTAEYLRSCRSERLRTVFLGQKTMPAIGRNIGAKEAKGQILAFIDSDAYAADDWAEQILKVNEKGCRAAGGSISLPPEQENKGLALVQYFLQFNEFSPYGLGRVADFAPSCNLFCERSLFEAVGGFPEIRASEDVLFGLAVNRREAFLFEPVIRVFHIFAESSSRFFSNQRMLGEYILIYRRMHFKKSIYSGIIPLFLLPGFTAVKFYKICKRVFQTYPKPMIISFLKTLPLFLAGLFFWAWGFAGACFKPNPPDVK